MPVCTCTDTHTHQTFPLLAHLLGVDPAEHAIVGLAQLNATAHELGYRSVLTGFGGRVNRVNMVIDKKKKAEKNRVDRYALGPSETPLY